MLLRISPTSSISRLSSRINFSISFDATTTALGDARVVLPPYNGTQRRYRREGPTHRPRVSAEKAVFASRGLRQVRFLGAVASQLQLRRLLDANKCWRGGRLILEKRRRPR